MAISDLITGGIGPGGDIPHFLTFGLTISSPADAVPIVALRFTGERYNLRSTETGYMLIWTGERYEIRSTEEAYRLLATNERYRLRRT